MATSGRKKVVRRKKPVKAEVPKAGKAVLVIFGTGARDSYHRIKNGRKDVTVLHVDAGSELLDKGLTPDCASVFSIDHYIPEGLIDYESLEAYVQADETFGKILREMRETVMEKVPVETENWEQLKRVRRDTLGGGGLIYFGVLRLLAAMVGRSYQPNKALENGDPNPDYDTRDDVVLHPELKKREPDVKWVSLYDDLWDVFDTVAADFVCFEGGFDGATGSSGTYVGMKVFGTSAQIATMPLLAVALPEYFMVDGTIHPDHADRLAQTVSLFDKVCVIAGLGGEGVFWQAVVENMRAWAGIYSNLEGIALRRKCAPVLLISICTHRPDLEKRWTINLLVTNRMSPEEAREKILFYAGLTKDEEGNPVKNARVALYSVVHAQGYGVRIETLHPEMWLINEWEELGPALAAAGRSIGASGMALPCKVKVEQSRNWLGKPKYAVVDRELPIESVPVLKTLARAVGKETLEEAFDDIGFWALTKPEKFMVAQYGQLTFDKAFQAITDGFKPVARDYMYGTLFEYKITPPSSMTYDGPQAVLAWAQPDVSVEELADIILGDMFAEVDRTAELTAEEEREQRLERLRRKAVQATRKGRLLRS